MMIAAMAENENGGTIPSFAELRHNFRMILVRGGVSSPFQVLETSLQPLGDGEIAHAIRPLAFFKDVVDRGPPPVQPSNTLGAAVGDDVYMTPGYERALTRQQRRFQKHDLQLVN